MTNILTAHQVCRAFGRTVAVDCVDLTLTTGARHALIGPNGAGKSTLLHLLAGTIHPTAGCIRLAGRDITRLAAHARARLGIGRTFQTPATYPSLSTLDNIVVSAWQQRPKRPLFTRRRELTRLAMRHLDAVGLAPHATRPAATLSHGQRRLLELAMALSSNPHVLLLDEPAAGLGDDDLHHLTTVIHRLPAEVAVLLVEHNQDLVAAVADTITVLHHGRTLATGAPADIHAHPGVADIYLGARVKGAL